MEKAQYLLSKAGPRIVNALVDSPEIDVLVTAPGMLFQKLIFVTNLTAFEGCDAGFYPALAADLAGTVYCGHEAPLEADIRVEIHRLGTELMIELEPPSMYQSLLRLRTRSGRTFKQAIMASLSAEVDPEGVIAGFYVERATSHHEFHKSAVKTIREHARAFQDEQ